MRRQRGPSEKGVKLAQDLGQLQPFVADCCIPIGMHEPTCVCWANLTPFSLAELELRPAWRQHLTGGRQRRACVGARLRGRLRATKVRRGRREEERGGVLAK